MTVAHLHRPVDRWLLAAAALEGALVLAGACLAAHHRFACVFIAPMTGALICHLLNTVSHVHLHTPLFQERRHNRWLALYLSAISGVPQALWRARHFAHHAGRAARTPRLHAMLGQIACIGALVALLGLASPRAPLCFALSVVCGLGIAQLQGAMEHARGAVLGVSYHGAFYNWLWFNDGYHAEHHAAPRVHWSELPERQQRATTRSNLPPQLRWLAPHAGASQQPRAAMLGPRLLCGLERLCLHCPPLARALVSVHARAFVALSSRIGRPMRISIVGGGLFPRSVLVLAPLFADAQLTVIDARRSHLAVARRYLAVHAPELATRVRWRRRFVTDVHAIEADLIVLPLACEGPLRTGARHAHAVVAVHRVWGAPDADASHLVSRWLLKKICIVLPT